MPGNGKTVMAFDLGTTFGWARGIVEDDTLKALVSGNATLKLDRFSGGGMRFLRFERMLAEMLVDTGVGAVFYEEVRRHQGTDAAHVYGGLQAVLTSRCELWGIPYEAFPVGTIKKFATGKGNAPKEAMVEAARRLPGRSMVVDDNEADAVHVLRLGLVSTMGVDLGRWK